MVSVLAFYSDNPSLNPTDASSFFVKFVFEKNKNKQKEVGVGPFNKEWSTLSDKCPFPVQSCTYRIQN